MLLNSPPMTLANSEYCYATHDLSQLLKAAGDDLRLSILQALAKDSYGVLELAEAFGVRQSGISHHLKVLAGAGLVENRREGNSIFYRRAMILPDTPGAPLVRALFQQLDNLPLASSYREGLRQVWHERAQRSQQFFLENATKFKAQQDLIASFDVYRGAVSELLQMTATPTNGSALEVGPGEGEFLPVLCERFTRVLALDNSQAMLDRSRQLAQAHSLANVDFLLGDTRALNDYYHRFDCAVINMVLHHTPSPSHIFFDVAQSLTPGGVLLVTELRSHDQTWTRDSCGDLWLGFTPDDLQGWAGAAGLTAGESVHLALRNGFQIQIQQYFKPIQTTQEN